MSAHTERQNLVKGLAFLSPWIVGFCLFTLVPVVLSAYYSLTDFTLLQPPAYIGAENYRTMVKDPQFWQSLRVTFTYAAVALPLTMVIALALAMLLNVKIAGQSIYRTIIFLPSLVPTVAGAMVWMWMLNSKLGLVNGFLNWLGVDDPPNWLGSVEWAMPSIIVMSLWGVGHTVVIYLAGLQDVPRELYEAADLDGATRWQQIVHVTLPMLSPVIFFNLIMAIIGTLQNFAGPFIITQGGPLYSTYFYTIYLFEKAFVHLNMGFASALAWVQLLLVLVLTAIAFWSSKKWVHYQGK
jgi:multiple sugar transport system permease protein